MDFSGAPPTNLRWIDEANYLQMRRAGRGVEWLIGRRGIRTRRLRCSTAARMEDALAALPGMTREKAADSARSADLTFNPSRTAALVTIDDDLYFYDFSAGRAARLTSAAGAEEEATFSPNGRSRRVRARQQSPRRRRRRPAGARADERRLVVPAQRQARLAVPGRDLRTRPVPRLLVEPRLDAPRLPPARRTAGPEYTVVDDIPYRPTVEVTDYPKAGDPNPLVEAWRRARRRRRRVMG